MTTHKLTKADLRPFVGGTEHWYPHGMVRDIVFTDGVKYIADKGGAYWLIDEIAFAQAGNIRVAEAAFQVWTLTVRPDRTATLRCEGDNGNALFTKDIALTDFPLDEVQIWFTDKTILLPDEY